MRTRHTLTLFNESAFPLYDVSDLDEMHGVVTPVRLEKAKWQARHLFKLRHDFTRRKFYNYAMRKYKRCKRHQVRFDSAGALRRIRDAQLSHEDMNLLGQTDGSVIEIMGVAMSHAQIVGTLIHEALHDWCFVRGRAMACENEHYCMVKVGEPYE